MSEVPDERTGEIRTILADEAAQPELFSRDVDVKALAGQIRAEVAAGSGPQQVQVHPDLQPQLDEELRKQTDDLTPEASSGSRSTVSKVSPSKFRDGYDAIFGKKNGDAP